MSPEASTLEARIWTGEDFRALKAALRISRNVEDAAKRLNRDPREVEEVARDLGWLESPPLIPEREG